jgi:hypothetical protein
MQMRLLTQTAILLALTQFVLGAIGYLLRGIPWLGLPLIFCLGWMIIRTARILREEMVRAARRGLSLQPWATALFIAVMWQLPALVCAPFWAPSFLIWIWQGSVLPVFRTIQLLPGLSVPVDPVLWLAVLAEMGLFVWAAGRSGLLLKPARPQATLAAGRMPGAGGAASEWAPARRCKDVPKRRRVESEQPGDPE